MNDDIRISVTWYYNLKRKQIIRRLGHKGAIALIDLWIYAAQHRPDGNLAGMTPEDIAEASQYRGKPASYIKTLKDLKFLDGNEGNYKLHDWERHQPWVVGSEVRSEAARKAARARWDNAERMRAASVAHPERNAPLPSLPIPTLPIPTRDTDKSDNKPSGRDATQIWTDAYRIKIDSTYKPTEIDAKQLKRALKHLGSDLDLFRECVKNCLDDPYFRDNLPGAAFFYRHIEKYKKPVRLPGEIRFV